MMRNYAVKIARMDPVSSSSKAEAMPDWASVSAVLMMTRYHRDILN